MKDVNKEIKKSLETLPGEDERKDTKLGGLIVKSLLGGDFLITDTVRRQAKLLALVMFFVIFYINNRYIVQRQLIDIASKENTLTDIKYNALTCSSELMERSRQSRIEEYIATQSSKLRTPTNPPYLIKDDKKNEGE
jgi:hypothetical protein